MVLVEKSFVKYIRTMSRIGKQPIELPEKVTMTIADGSIVVKGPNGEVKVPVHPKVKVEQKDNTVSVTVANPEDKDERALWGLYGSLLSNMMKGVTTGFERKLEINGVGYKVAASGNTLNLSLGYSHDIKFEVPKTVKAVVEKNVITLTGADKQEVGQVAAKIRALRKPEPYKGKGIKYMEEVIRRKEGKQAKAGE